MKKALIKIITSLLMTAIIIISSFVITVYTRGDIDDYILPKGFEETIDNANPLRNENAYARIMTANVLAHYESWGGTDARRRAKMFLELLDTYSPDIVAMQEMCDQWYCALLKNAKNYRLIYPLSTGTMARTTGIIYNSDTVDLLDYGQYEYTKFDEKRVRRIVWGYFQNKESGEKYIVTSTHFNLIRENQETESLNIMNTQADEQVAIAKNLQIQFNCPIFCAGDYNAMDNGGYDNPYFAPTVYDALTVSLNDTKSYARRTTEGDARDVRKPTQDHIFMLGNATIERYSIISDTVMQEMSDHYPIFIDVS